MQNQNDESRYWLGCDALRIACEMEAGHAWDTLRKGEKAIQLRRKVGKVARFFEQCGCR